MVVKLGSGGEAAGVCRLSFQRGIKKQKYTKKTTPSLWHRLSAKLI